MVAHSLPAGDGREALLLGDGMARRLYGDTAVSGFDDLEVVSTGGASAIAAVSRIAAQYGMNAVPVATIRDNARQAQGGPRLDGRGQVRRSFVERGPRPVGPLP